MKKLCVITLYMYILLTPLWGQELLQLAEKKLHGIYGENALLQYEKMPVTMEMRKDALRAVSQNYYFKYLYYWKVFQNDSLVAHAFVDNVFGKQMPITFLVVFDDTQKIVYNDILKYREIKGRAVKRREWLDLFLGKNAESGFEYGSEIDALSGSTISAKNMTKGVHKLCYLVQKVHDSYIASKETPKR